MMEDDYNYDSSTTFLLKQAWFKFLEGKMNSLKSLYSSESRNIYLSYLVSLSNFCCAKFV